MEAPKVGISQTPALCSQPPTASVGTEQQNGGTKKRKLDVVGFQNSAYFKIRATIRCLRPHFVQVLQAPEFRDCKAVHEIQKQMKIMLELCKQLSVESASHLKEQTDNLVGKPSVPNTSDGTADRTSQPDNIPKQSEVVGNGLESDISSNPRDITPEVPEAVISGKSTEQQLQGTEGCSYVVGGSPVNPGTGKKCPHPILLSSALRDGFAGLIYFMGKYLVQVRDGSAAPGKKNSNPFLTEMIRWDKIKYLAEPYEVLVFPQITSSTTIGRQGKYGPEGANLGNLCFNH